MPFNSKTAAEAGRKGKRKSYKKITRNKQILIHVTEEEYQLIVNKASKHGLSRPDLIVLAVKQYNRRNKTMEEIKEMLQY